MADFDRDYAIAAVRDAGDLALKSWRRGRATSSRTWQKGTSGPVSEADLAVDRLLHERLRPLLPEAGWLSEEAADSAERLSQRLLWVIDPIDGTRDFVHGRAGWAVSVALVVDRKPVFGALYAPVSRDMWVGHSGGGATRNGVILCASQCQSVTGARIPAKHLPASASDVVAVDCPNSIALRMAKVAANEADILSSVRWGSEWDLAAAEVIARESGAIVSDAYGATIDYNGPDGRVFGVVCSAPALHLDWIERLKPRVAEVLAEDSD